MTLRSRLPNRRGSLTFEIELRGLKFTCTASRFADGRLGEIFVTNHKANSNAGIMASDGAVAASLALQFGCPVEVLRKALCRDGSGKASGPVGAALDALDDGGAS
jgi:hypothetical protein